MAILITNNASTTLLSGLSTVDTTITLALGTGDMFPEVVAPDYTYVTIENSSGDLEIVKVVARTSGSDSMTVERGQDNTSPLTWNAGDLVELRPVAIMFSSIIADIATRELSANKGVANGYPSLNAESKVEQVALNADEALAITGMTFASAGTKIDNFPVGTSLLFYDLNPPSGWVSHQISDYALRTANQNAGGGTATSTSRSPFSTIFSSTARGVSATGLSIAQMPAHTHTSGSYSAESGGSHRHPYGFGGVGGGSGPNVGGAHYGYTGYTEYDGVHTHTVAGSSGSAGSGTTHTHTVSFAVRYVNIIMAYKA